MAEAERHDVVVLGGGAAGVGCALECLDVKLDVLLVEARTQLGGQLAEVPNSIRNLPAGCFRDGEALRRALEESAVILGERKRLGCEVLRADLDRRWLEAGDHRIDFRALVIGSGRECRRLSLAVEGDFGGDVTYQIEWRPGQFSGRPVAVVGAGDSASLDALELAKGGSHVFHVHRARTLSARADIVADIDAEPGIEELAGWEVESLAGAERLEGITVVKRDTGERRVLPVGGLVVKVGYAPNTKLFDGQIELADEGGIVVGLDLATSREGVFAAGDVLAGSYPRVATAMGQGVLAARSVLHYLSQQAR
jgi:thioredoxin reductase (NADPH)